MKRLPLLKWFFCCTLALISFERAWADPLELHTRSCVESSKGSGKWWTVDKTVQWEPKRTALVVCDMWNQHWCKGATERVAEMAPRMNEVLNEARRRGVLIIHCPSGTMKHYEGTPQRKLAQSASKIAGENSRDNWGGLEKEREGALPIDDSDGGCDDTPQCKPGGPWTHQIDTLQIKEGDAITDSAEAYYLMKQRGITNLIVLGVHGNMCVLGRPFSIRQMVHRGENVVFMRDMIDTMYNSRMRPKVSHFSGTDLISEHIEKYWCPSITSVDFLGGTPFHFQADKRPHVVFIIGENEYYTWETVPEFARHELVTRNLRCSFVTASATVGDNLFPAYKTISEADLLFISVRRRTPPKEMLALIRNHLNAGKPLAGIRTASHAFGAKPEDDEHEGWQSFDLDVLGCNYQGHYGNNSATRVQVLPGATSHPILTGVPPTEFAVTSSLYKIRNPGPNVTPLMIGKTEDQAAEEPVAWINTAKNRRVFYTSLGNTNDFNQPFFRKLLLNGILWSLDQPIPSLSKN
jgi:type 1 glutamine amidotransferase/nicotinamidase-related amidase